MESSNVSLPVFDEAVKKIEQYYRLHPTGMGWRFSFGPKASLVSGLSMWFIGVQPGGAGPDVGEPSREDGNGYRLEGWSDRDTPNPLQRNVMCLFQMLGECLGKSWERLLDQCFTSNVCPIRAPDSDCLKQILPEWKAFSLDLWSPVLLEYGPSVVVCNGREAHSVLCKSAAKIGLKRNGEMLLHPTGWGNLQWYEDRYQDEDRTLMLICIPHLSHFKIFTSEKCRQQSQAIVDLIASAVSDDSRK